MARPVKEINAAQVYKLARIGCTTPEIATICDVSPDTLERRFAGTLKKGRERMKMSLRRMQYKAAQLGDKGMMIWLGKQYLGQQDRVEVDHRVESEIERELARLATAGQTQVSGTPAQDPDATIH